MVMPLGLSIIKLCRAHRGAAGALLATLGLHSGQEMILMQLWREDGQSQKTLAQSLGIQAPTVTKMLQRLEAIGVITRRASSTDGRSMNAFLTDKGRDLKPKVHALLEQLEQRTTTDLSDAEVKLLHGLLARVVNNLHSSDADAPC